VFGRPPVEQAENSLLPRRGRTEGGDCTRSPVFLGAFDLEKLPISFRTPAAPEQRHPHPDRLDLAPVVRRLALLCEASPSLPERVILAMLALADS
jgi:hypothetical protein